MKFWDRYSTWEEAEECWEAGAKESAKQLPLKKLKVLPKMPGVTTETARHLKWKSFKYMLSHDTGGKVRRHIFKHPLRYAFRYLYSILKKKSYKRDGDFFLYGFPNVEAFEKEVKEENALLIVGFSYCQKPFECPSGRFTDKCISDPNNSICRQCDIGKVMQAMPAQKILPLMIPTVHYIGEKILEIVHTHPKRKVIFLITACEMTLEMFGDWGNMSGVRGIGIRLDGRICNTMIAFELSEKGIKPGLTQVAPTTQSRILELLRNMRSHASS